MARCCVVAAPAQCRLTWALQMQQSRCRPSKHSCMDTHNTCCVTACSTHDHEEDLACGPFKCFWPPACSRLGCRMQASNACQSAALLTAWSLAGSSTFAGPCTCSPAPPSSCPSCITSRQNRQWQFEELLVCTHTPTTTPLLAASGGSAAVQRKPGHGSHLFLMIHTGMVPVAIL